MTQQQKNKNFLDACSSCAGTGPIQWTYDERENPFGWLRLTRPEQLVDVAKALAEKGARLCTVTAYVEDREAQVNHQAVAYHFALADAVLTVTVPIFDEAAQQQLSLPSITPWFRNADWNEREFMEMFSIPVTGHPNPKRLFLDERLDAGIMSTLIPFSAMVHGAASRTLWEKVMAAKGIDISGEKYGTGEPHRAPKVSVNKPAQPAEPAFTPVSATEQTPDEAE